MYPTQHFEETRPDVLRALGGLQDCQAAAMVAWVAAPAPDVTPKSA
jgi:hypothetical protein